MSRIVILTGLLLIFTAAACCSDIRYKRISNKLTLTFLVSGIFINTLFSGTYGFCTAAMGLLTGILLLLLPYRQGWVGGGDIKLLAAAGSLTGPSIILYSTLCGLILFGAAALIRLTAAGRLKTFLAQLAAALSFSEKGLIEVTGRLPMGLFLSVGILLAWFYFKYIL